MFADGAFLQAIRFGELAHCLAVFPRAQTEHQLLPNRFRQRLAPMEHRVTTQPHFLVVGAAHPRPLYRNLLPHHHAIAALATPTMGLPFRLPSALSRSDPALLSRFDPGVGNVLAPSPDVL